MAAAASVRIALAGDVMLGRGIDQALPHPGDPALHERWVTSALDYVALAERRNGPIPRPVPLGYPWGDALDTLRAAPPDAFVVNLETAATRRGAPAPKGINYRVTPENLACLCAGGVDCAVLSNNHVLDWGTEGLLDTLAALDALGIAHAGAGRSRAEAAAPAILPLPGGRRLLVYGIACSSGGVPEDWAASDDRPGLDHLDRASPEAADRIAARIDAGRRDGDVVVLSIHWGGNWGYGLSEQDRRFARRLVDGGTVQVVHGHSSHHPRAIEIRDRGVILHGCGDLINDYEGISGHDEFRPDLACLHMLAFDADDGAPSVDLLPFRIRRFRLERAGAEATAWLRDVIARECGRAGPSAVTVDGEAIRVRAIPARRR